MVLKAFHGWPLPIPQAPFHHSPPYMLYSVISNHCPVVILINGYILIRLIINKLTRTFICWTHFKMSNSYALFQELKTQQWRGETRKTLPSSGLRTFLCTCSSSSPSDYLRHLCQHSPILPSRCSSIAISSHMTWHSPSRRWSPDLCVHSILSQPLLYRGNMVQDPQWMPETGDRTERYILSFPIYM